MEVAIAPIAGQKPVGVLDSLVKLVGHFWQALHKRANAFTQLGAHVLQVLHRHLQAGQRLVNFWAG